MATWKARFEFKALRAFGFSVTGGLSRKRWSPAFAHTLLFLPRALVHTVRDRACRQGTPYPHAWALAFSLHTGYPWAWRTVPGAAVHPWKVGPGKEGHAGPPGSKEPFGQEVLGLPVPTHDLEERVHLPWPHGLLMFWEQGGSFLDLRMALLGTIGNMGGLRTCRKSFRE